MQLELEHISKRYKDKLALEDVCVTMNPGVNGCWDQMEPGNQRSWEF